MHAGFGRSNKIGGSSDGAWPRSGGYFAISALGSFVIQAWLSQGTPRPQGRGGVVADHTFRDSRRMSSGAHAWPLRRLRGDRAYCKARNGSQRLRVADRRDRAAPPAPVVESTF